MTDTPITPQEAARIYGTTVAYIYKLATLNRWRKIKDGRRVLYNLSDIDAALGKQ